jgi:hypothetical protein
MMVDLEGAGRESSSVEGNVDDSGECRTFGGDRVEIARKGDPVYCPACGCDRVYRIERRGFVRKRIYTLFGLYPWECRECGREVLLKKRNRHRTRQPAVAK